MKLSEFANLVNAHLRACERNRTDPEVVIPVETIFPSIGGIPSVLVDHLSLGFDWNANSVFIYPKDKLIAYNSTTEEFKKKVRSDMDKDYFENRRLKKENSDLKKKLDPK